MKKHFYSIAFMALIGGVTVANAQAFKLDKNYVLTTAMKVADGTTVGEGKSGNEVNGGMIAKIGEAYLDADYNTLPISGGTAEGTNYHILNNDYTDAETGITFKAGTYACLNSNEEFKFKDTFNPQGISNIKKVIFYLASQGQLQTYVRQYAGTETEVINHFEGDPTNRKLKSYKAPGFQTESWTEMYFNKPLKLVVDVTNNQNGTVDEMTNAGLEPNKNADDTEVVNMYLQFYEQKTNPDGGYPLQGENLIPWTADSKFVVAFKKKAYIMGIALVCGDDNATNKYLDITVENPEWSDTPVSTAISTVTTAEQSVKNGAIYNLAGQRISAPVSGQLYIRDGKKFIKN